MSKLPSGWNEVTFGDVVEHIKDRIPDRSKWTFDRYIGGEHFDEGAIRVTKSSPIKGNEEIIGSAFHMRFRPGDVLYVTRNPRLRKGGMVNFEGICSNVTFTLRAKEEKLLQSLLPFIIQTELFVSHTINNTHGSTNPFLNWKDIAKFKFLLPPIEEQKKISEILWTAENNIEKTEKLIKVTEKFKKELLEELFTKGIGHTKYKKTELGEIPEEWNIVKLENIVSENPRNGIYKSKEYHGNGIKMINMREMFRYEIIDNPEMERIDLTDSEKERFLVKPGDLLFARRSLVEEGAGKCCLVVGNEPRTFESSIIRVSIGKDADPKFLFYLFNSNIGRMYIDKIVRKVAVSGITGKDLLKMLVALPKNSEQKNIVEIIERIEYQKQTLSKHIILLNNLKKKLTNEFLSGNLLIPTEVLN